jgi:hypothetical protein
MEDQPIFERSSDRNENAGIAERPKRGENHFVLFAVPRSFRRNAKAFAAAELVVSA